MKMTLNLFFKTTLLLGTTAALVACSGGSREKAAADVVSSAKAQKTEKRPYKMISYDTAGQTDADHLYLEEVLGEKALDEVKAWNERSLDRLKADPRYQTFYEDALTILQSKDKIPYVSYRNDEVHNFWQDETHVRGVWRKSTLNSYLSDKTEWETVLDFDKLSADEGKNWVYKGNNCLAPDNELCMVDLSDGGKDAVVRREFNTRTKTFVKDGFVTEESKGTMSWVDENTVVIGVDFGEGTMTDSGYPRQARLWSRAQNLADAVVLGQGEKTDVDLIFRMDAAKLSSLARLIFIIQKFSISQGKQMVVSAKCGNSQSRKNQISGQSLKGRFCWR